MGKCSRCGIQFVGTAANPHVGGLCRLCEITRLQDALDMQRDEFRRITALLHPTRDMLDLEIVGICQRAQQNIEQTLPVILQRDRLQIAVSQLRLALAELVGAGDTELDAMEATLRCTPGDLTDKIAAINAIHALRSTIGIE